MLNKSTESAKKRESIDSTAKWRRHFPRFGLNCPALIKTAADEAKSAMVRDISMRGLQIVAVPATAKAIYSGSEPLTKQNAPKLSVTLRLPLVAGPVPVTFPCRVSYIKIQPAGSVVFGLSYTVVEGKAREQLEQYFTLSMQPAEM